MCAPSSSRIFPRFFSRAKSHRVRFHPDIDAEAQFEIENAHVGLWASEMERNTEISSETLKQANSRAQSQAATPKPLHPPKVVSHRSKSPKGFVPMTFSQYMPVTARALCLASNQVLVRGQPFTPMERDAILSFIIDNPLLPVGSRKTWEIFIQETGSLRNSGERFSTPVSILKAFTNQSPTILCRCSEVVCII